MFEFLLKKNKSSPLSEMVQMQLVDIFLYEIALLKTAEAVTSILLCN